MSPLSIDLRRVLAEHIQAVSTSDIIAIASTLCSGESGAPAVTPVKTVGTRFQVNADQVADAETGLVWTRENVPGGKMTWTDAKKAAEAIRIGGHTDWRLPTIKELLTLVDYDRHEPAINTDAFVCDSGWYWTSAPWHGSPGVYAWIVYFYYGYSGWHYQSVEYHVRAVRAGECHEVVSLKSLHAAWREARRGKRPSSNQLSFDTHWLDGLLELQKRLKAGTWRPGPATCFIATAPKAREIHAPDFADRVVHHWLVPQLEAIYEPTFIHDAYSNRKGKGTHAAVDRLRDFVRQVESGQGGGWFLQLDIKNFFVSIHRPTLYGLLKARIERHGLSLPCRRAVHALLRRSAASDDVIFRCTPAERAAVPTHKRLENAGHGRGIAIGNLSSQFFANVYLNELDQFVKHELKAQRYVRYVDDFVLVHESRTQLLEWQERIEQFVRTKLKLELKADRKLQSLDAGIDFLGYVVYPRHTLVRRRVIVHAREKLDAWRSAHVRGRRVLATADQRDELRSVCASYAGHFRHANSYRLRGAFRRRYPWLRTALARRSATK